jgi:hypothetical protein
MFNIPGHKGNANQNDMKISSYPNQNVSPQKHKQEILAKLLYTVDGNVN